MEEEKPKNKGGHPYLGGNQQKRIGFALDKDLIPFVDEMSNKNRFINKSIRFMLFHDCNHIATRQDLIDFLDRSAAK